MKNAEHLFRIIREIESGDRLHVQETYHKATECGTAHDIAGWIVHDLFLEKIEMEPEYFVIESKFSTESDLVMCLSPAEVEAMTDEDFDCNNTNPWMIAARYLDITNEEGKLIFSADLTIETIRKSAEILNQVKEKSSEATVFDFLEDDTFRITEKSTKEDGSCRFFAEEINLQDLLKRAKETGKLTAFEKQL